MLNRMQLMEVAKKEAEKIDLVAKIETPEVIEKTKK